jgi:NAD(P)-dependent dehydrogenase (short-subunit alcohol dehydrogenase family)
VPDQTGKTFLITGANTGLGFETARVLARRKARVVLACRDAGRGQRAANAIRGETPEANVELIALDLADLGSVRSCAEAFAAAHDRLDVLVNNAGVMAIPYRETPDRFEMQFATNHLGHFALTGRLLPLLLATSGSRVVALSSLVHERGAINFDDPFFHHRHYEPWGAYSQSKLANLLFTFELDRRLRRHGAPTIAVAAHPGYADTELQARGPAMRGLTAWRLLMRIANTLFAQSAEAGAWPELRAATDPHAHGGDYFGPAGAGEIWGRAARVQPSAAARDEQSAARLWEMSEKLTGVNFEIWIRQRLGQVPNHDLLSGHLLRLTS